jgi:hypothetical protein
MMLLSNFHVGKKVAHAFLIFHSVNMFEPGTVRVTVRYGLIRVTVDVRYMVAHFCLLACVVCCGSKHIHGGKGGSMPLRPGVLFFVVR